MRLIKVDAIDSTNTFIKQLYKVEQFTNPVCVVAREQFAGKGQMGTRWSSKPGENLTCSVFMPLQEIALQQQFYIAMAVSLAIYQVLDTYQIPDVKIKWPNDILSGKQKICGILLENIVSNGRLAGVVIGIGLNINQKAFPNVPRAISLSQILGRSIAVEEVLTEVLKKLSDQFAILRPSHFEELKVAYERVLFRKQKPSTFKNGEGSLFTGIIQGISPIGKLQVRLEDEVDEEFNLKEIELLY